jgi:AraC-like DNA-binding protein
MGMPAASARNARARAWNVGPDLSAYCQAVAAAAVILPLESGLDSRTGAWSCSGRVLEDHLLHFYIDGSATLRAGTASFRLSTGSCLWLPAGIAHDIAASGPRTIFRLRFRMPAPAGPVHPLVLADAGHLRPLADAADAELRMPSELSALRLRCLLATLLSHVGAGPATETAATRGIGVLRANQRRQLERYVSTTRMPWPEPADLARELALTPGWFARAFRRSYGVSPRRWLADRRVRAAADLLALEGCTVAEAATRLGFAHQGQFARRFRAVFGRTPTVWIAAGG